MKVRSSVKKMCKACKVVKYNQKTYIRCKENPRHKQRQLFSTLQTFIEPYHNIPILLQSLPKEESELKIWTFSELS